MAAVVVTFHPNLNTLENLLSAVAPQVSHIAVIDNGSEQQDLALLCRRTGEDRLSFIPLGENLGIAAAQNRGIETLLAMGFEAILLLDQDSIPAPDMVARLVEAANALTSQGMKVAAVSPVSIDSRTRVKARIVRLKSGNENPTSKAAIEVDATEADFLIASGCLLSAAAIRDVGDMNEGYFIDHVDTEWCLRARAKGWRLFNVDGAQMSHTLGERIVRVWFGRWREVAVHSPLRDYYMLRNTVFLLRHAPMAAYWRLFHLLRIVQFLAFFCVAIPPRLLRLRMMGLGLWHGLTGRTGRLDSAL